MCLLDQKGSHLLLKALDDLPDEAARDPIGLDHDEGLLEGHLGDLSKQVPGSLAASTTHPQSAMRRGIIKSRLGHADNGRVPLDQPRVANSLERNSREK